MLSDRGIQQARQSGNIVIEPFDEEDSLTPVGYDLRVGEFAFSWKKRERVLVGNQEKLEIAPGDSVLISTLERIKLSPNIGGTVHSKVTQILTGFAHLSTTIDPGWPGPRHDPGHLLVAIHNRRSIPLELRHKQRFCTVIFSQVLDPQSTHEAHPNATLSQDPWGWLGTIESQARAAEEKPFYRYGWFWFVSLGILIGGISAIFFRPTEPQDWIQLAGVVALFIIAALRDRA